MRSRLVVLALAAVAIAVRLSATADADALATLYEAHDWFALRDAVHDDSPALYRGAVASAFNDAANARKYLDEAIAAAPGSDQATEARGLLIYLYQRERRYADALEQVRTIRKSLPDASGLKNAEALFTALSRYPEQSLVIRASPSTVHYEMKGGNLFVPVEINRARADYLIDTGANFSIISQAEAKRLGLAVTASGATGTVVTGAQVPFRTALAPMVNIGSVSLHNVVFLVSPDSNQPFAGLPRGWRGALGIPVLLALETLRWTATGEFDIGRAADRRDLARSNLCFEGASPLVQGTFQDVRLPLVLDTGATRTNLGPRFAREFHEAVRDATKRSRVIGGVGDRVTVESLSVPEIALDVGGRALLLRPAHVLLRQLAADDRWFYGRIGMDSLRQAPVVTIDFSAMTLRLER